jgi:hypothetical protein
MSKYSKESRIREMRLARPCVKKLASEIRKRERVVSGLFSCSPAWSAKTFRHFPENKELMETSSDSFGCKNFQVIHLAEKLTVMLTFFLSFFL